jgi:hypothetical protein
MYPYSSCTITVAVTEKYNGDEHMAPCERVEIFFCPKRAFRLQGIYNLEVYLWKMFSLEKKSIRKPAYRRF